MKIKLVILWLLPAFVGLGFLIAGLGKAISPEPTQAVLAMVGLPNLVNQMVVYMLPPLEVALGIGLFLRWHSKLLIITSLGLLVIFVLFLTQLALVDYTADCSCFGTLIDSWSSGGPVTAILRNIILAVFVSLPLFISRDLYNPVMRGKGNLLVSTRES